jgi:hypothetical protein
LVVIAFKHLPVFCIFSLILLYFVQWEWKLPVDNLLQWWRAVRYQGKEMSARVGRRD